MTIKNLIRPPTFNIYFGQPSSDYTIQVWSMDGKKLISDKCSSCDVYTLYSELWKPGIYQLRIMDKDARLYTNQLVKVQ